MAGKRLLLFLVALLWVTAALAQNLLPVPALTAHVVDQTNTLDAIQLKGLEDKLKFSARMDLKLPIASDRHGLGRLHPQVLSRGAFAR